MRPPPSGRLRQQQRRKKKVRTQASKSLCAAVIDGRLDDEFVTMRPLKGEIMNVKVLEQGSVEIPQAAIVMEAAQVPAQSFTGGSAHVSTSEAWEAIISQRHDSLDSLRQRCYVHPELLAIVERIAAPLSAEGFARVFQ